MLAKLLYDIRHLSDSNFVCHTYANFPLILCIVLDPGDRPPLLLISSTEYITGTHLNGSSVSSLKPLKTNGTRTLDFVYKEDSLCWLSSTNSTRQLWCATMTKLKGFSQPHQLLREKYLSSVCQIFHSVFLMCFLLSMYDG